jgi:hypothetical protein
LTRGVFALAKLRWSEAIHFNALTPLAALMLLSLLSRGPWVSRLWATGGVAFIAYGLYRVL